MSNMPCVIADSSTLIHLAKIGQLSLLKKLYESEARRIADLYGLPKTGTIGILIKAKQEGQILGLRSELEKLRQVAGFWIEEALYQQALSVTGEADVS
jgi:hypothetical protein